MEIIFSKDKKHEKFLYEGLNQYAKKFSDLDTFEKDDWGFYLFENNKQIGGVHGRTLAEGWLYVELFYIDENYRGKDLGTMLMEKVKQHAIENKCFGIYLDTLSFEARGFYEKMGFNLHGELKDYPFIGFSKYSLHKRLTKLVQSSTTNLHHTEIKGQA